MARVLFSYIFIVFCIFLACDSKLADSPQPSYFKLSMTVEKGELQVTPDDSLLINIASIRLWRGEELRDWAIVSDTNRVYNLFELIDTQSTAIANKETVYLPPGDYHRLTIRMLLTDTTMVLNGKSYPVQIPSEDLQIVNIDQILNLEEGKIFNLNVIFDADESLSYKLGRYTFIPTFKLNNQNVKGY